MELPTLAQMLGLRRTFGLAAALAPQLLQLEVAHRGDRDVIDAQPTGAALSEPLARAQHRSE
eukprot:scaffold14602_cov118-Isochrysis_galbana.AAC.8